MFIDYLDHLGSGYDAQLCSGFDAACQVHDSNLVFVVGRALYSPDPISAIHNEVYKLVHPGCVDGLILIAGGLSASCGLERLEQLCESFKPLALCSLGIQIPSVPSIVLDNHLGMQAVVEHIISDHGCRHVAFIGGPENNTDAAARLQVYRHVLKNHGLTFDSRLTESSEFTYDSGLAAAQRLVENGAHFDALIAANDGIALGAIEALKRRGLRIPRDVRVAGFDDLTSARFSNPPLTTARQPLERMAAMAVERIVAQWGGQPVPLATRQPVELVKRRSCGCHQIQRDAAVPQVPVQSTSIRQHVEENFERMLNHLNERTNGLGHGPLREYAPLLLALLAEADGQKDFFLTALDEFLEQGGVPNETFDNIQSAVSFLRDELLSIGAVQFEALWEGARRSISLANSRWQFEQRAKLEQTYQKLLSCSERFSGAPDFTTFGRVLVEELPRIPMNNAFVALCNAGNPSEFEPLLCLCDGRSLTSLEGPLLATDLLAVANAQWSRRRTSLVLPLTFECQFLGVAIFEPESGLGVCGMLREQIGFAVKSIALHQEIVQKTALHERSVKERIATTAHMESLRVMAGGVAHDLNSALSPLVTLPDVILGLLKRLGVDEAEDGKRLRYYLETIGSAANRATQTIRDLMTLGRQGRTQKAPLDLNWIVASCLSAEPQLASGEHDIQMSVNLHPTTLQVNASQHHIERAISNLVRNAIEAIGENGTISVYTAVYTTDGPIAGHELVGPGTYASVSVTDNGPGIPADMIGRVFEPFFTSKKLGDKSGSGLGLSIVHEVVKEHEGFIDVISEEGRGTTFTLHFPLLAQVPRAARDFSSMERTQVVRRARDGVTEPQEVPSAVHDRPSELSKSQAPDCTPDCPACKVGS